MLNGIIERDGGYYYYNTGKPEMAGMLLIDGDYYFAKDGKGTLVTNRVSYNWKSNGLLPAGDYEYGPDGKMLNGIVERDGNYYYYNTGKPEMAGLVEVDGSYYFAKDGKGTLVTDQTYYIWKANGILPESERMFGADGKMLDGFITKDDGIYYYEDGKVGTVGLNYIDGYYYFVGYDGKLVTSRTYYVWKTNGLSIQREYTFDAQGRIVL
jgi:glucan-binding YG repeat protein